MSVVNIIKSLLEYESLYNNQDVVTGKLNAILIYYVPAIILNYLVFIHKSRYKNLLKKYQPENGKYIIYFMCLALAVFIFSLLII